MPEKETSMNIPQEIAKKASGYFKQREVTGGQTAPAKRTILYKMLGWLLNEASKIKS